MQIIRDWDLRIDADQVLRGQGADPVAIRSRSPRLVEYAQRAIEEGMEFVHPQLIYRRMKVESLVHENLILEGKNKLRGKLIAQHFPTASEVLLILCTIGEQLDEVVAAMIETDPVYALAIDGLGSAAVEAIANNACHQFETEAQENGFETSIPLSPGMEAWPIEQGQPQIFDLVNGEEIGISLTSSFMMLPRKSLSMVLGIGDEMALKGTTCDYCTLRESCRYQDHYAKDN